MCNCSPVEATRVFSVAALSHAEKRSRDGINPISPSFLLPFFSPYKNCISSAPKDVHKLIQSSSTGDNMAKKGAANFHDLLPVMAEKLGGEGLINELCNGFQLLMDKDKGVITLDSLRRNSSLLGLRDMAEEELLSMMREGDLDGDGALNQMEFCVLMFRLSPELMEESFFWLQHALDKEFIN